MYPTVTIAAVDSGQSCTSRNDYFQGDSKSLVMTIGSTINTNRSPLTRVKFHFLHFFAHRVRFIPWWLWMTNEGRKCWSSRNISCQNGGREWPGRICEISHPATRQKGLIFLNTWCAPYWIVNVISSFLPVVILGYSQYRCRLIPLSNSRSSHNTKKKVSDSQFHSDLRSRASSIGSRENDHIFKGPSRPFRWKGSKASSHISLYHQCRVPQNGWSSQHQS